MAVVSNLHILIFCLRVLLCIHIIQGLNINGHGVCSKKNEIGDWEYFCCFNFYRLNGICTECENGTVSRDGISCTKCIGKTYGHQCKFKCICLAEERCDLRFGCVNDFHITTTEAGPKFTVHEGTLETRSTIIPSGETRSTIIPSGDSMTTYFYYILTAAVSIVFTILCVSCIAFIHKRQHGTTQNFPVETFQEPVEVPLRPISQTSHHIYHFIDDSVLTNIQHMSTHNEDGGLKCCNLPNSLMQSGLMQIASRVSDDSTNSSSYDEFDELDYLNPYTTLKEKSKRETVIHEYETINKVFESSKNWSCDSHKGQRSSIPIGTDFANFIVVQNTIHSAHNDQSLKTSLYRKCSTF